MVMIEVSPPFQWHPTLQKVGLMTRLMWGWFAIAYVPMDFNEYTEGLGRAGIDLYLKGELEGVE